MSWLSSLGGKIKDGVVGAGHAVGEVADNKWTKAALAAGLAATGVGAPAAAALMASEGLLGGALHPGGGLRDAATGAATGAASGLGAAAAGGAVRGAMNGGLSGILKIPGAVSSVAGLAKNALGGGAPAPEGGGGTDPMNGVGLPGGGDYSIDPLTMGLAGAGMANAAALGKKSNDFADNAWNSVNNDWQARAGMRSQGIADATALAKPRNVDTSSLSAIRSQIAPSMSAGPTLGTRAPV